MRDKVEVTNLNTGETATESARESFSSTRNIVGKFNMAENTIKSAFQKLNIKRGLFPPSMKVLIQQMEGIEGGFSDIEKRALRDLAEQVGANTVYLAEHTNRLSQDDALTILKGKPQ
jgi:hypothetical protein